MCRFRVCKYQMCSANCASHPANCSFHDQVHTLLTHSAGQLQAPGSPQDTCDPGTFVITASAAACIVSVDSSCVVFCGAGLRREHRTAENDITDTADTLAWCSTDTAILLLILTVGETQLITADNDIFTDYVLGLLTRCHWRRVVL